METYRFEAFLPEKEPYYRSQGDEVSLGEAAHANLMPLLIKGPTGCGRQAQDPRDA